MFSEQRSEQQFAPSVLICDRRRCSLKAGRSLESIGNIDNELLVVIHELNLRLQHRDLFCTKQRKFGLTFPLNQANSTGRSQPQWKHAEGSSKSWTIWPTNREMWVCGTAGEPPSELCVYWQPKWYVTPLKRSIQIQSLSPRLSSCWV